MSDLKVYIAQVNQFWEDKEANFNHLHSLMNQTEFTKNSLLILPEMFNTGFSTNPEGLNEPWENSTSINWLKEKSLEFEIAIIASLIIDDHGKFYNRLVFIEKGEVSIHYDKNYLFSLARENEKFTPGTKRQVKILNGWKILPLICYDLRFPELSRIQNATEPEYELLVYTANWPKKRIKHWEKLIQARAIENLSYTIGVNRTGKDGNDLEYNGSSMLVNPNGEVQLLLKNAEEGIFEVVLSKETVYETRQRFGFLRDIKN